MDRYSGYVGEGDLALDIGIGKGETSAVLLSLGAQVVAVDRDAGKLAYLASLCPEAILIVAEVDGTGCGDKKTLDMLAFEYGDYDLIRLGPAIKAAEILQGLSCAVPALSFHWQEEQGAVALRACLERLESLGMRRFRLRHFGQSQFSGLLMGEEVLRALTCEAGPGTKEILAVEGE
jgi:SAM-dependent methyltransferase